MRIKKKYIISFSLFIIAALLIGYSYYNNIRKSTKVTKEISSAEPIDESISNEADLSFAVFGDVHDNISNFEDSIDEFYKLNPNMDALVLNGDTVDQGKDEQYEEVKKSIEKNQNKLPEIIIKNIGNHEFYNYEEDTNTQEDIDNFTNKYLKFAERDKVYEDQWIKGYHFISLGSDNLESADLSSTQASLSEEQLSWLKEKLSENYTKGNPIFVFIHQPISSNFFGSQWYGVKQGDELVKILSEYPEAIVFSSHTHKEFDEDTIIQGKPYTMIHTGAIGYTLVTDSSSSNGRRRDNEENNAIYVEVKDNKVTINERDILNHKWILQKTLDSNQ